MNPGPKDAKTGQPLETPPLPSFKKLCNDVFIESAHGCNLIETLYLSKASALRAKICGEGVLDLSTSSKVALLSELMPHHQEFL